VETFNTRTRILQSWRFLSSTTLSGAEQMRLDAECLNGVEQNEMPPTLRFFRFREPTLSYGRLQKFDDIARLVPEGWTSVQRPTGGGIVLHNGDLCFSLCWSDGTSPLPTKPQDQYRWIHSIVLQTLLTDTPARMAACCDVPPSVEPFAVRACFTNPVGFDLLKDQKKIVGGALRCTRRSTLYQGSLQLPDAHVFEDRLTTAFQKALL
jgi:lipoate-protein ligase A